MDSLAKRQGALSMALRAGPRYALGRPRPREGDELLVGVIGDLEHDVMQFELAESRVM